jgi:IS1 family transposase
MAHSKLPEETVERLLKCQRWGVCDAGTADICGVDIKTVHRFQQVASQRAQEHHRQVVREVSVEGVQLDEAHSKLRGGIKAWIHTALAMESLFLLWVDVGLRTQEMAAEMLAQVVMRVQSVPMFFTDGWRVYPAALLQVLGVIYRPRRRGKVGRKPKPRLVAPKHLFYAQVVKTRNRAGRVIGVCTQVVFGGPRRFLTQMRLRNLGTTIHTAFMERWYGTVRGLIAPLRRRTRCLSRCPSRHKGRLWLVVDLYNFVMPHRSLRQGQQHRTPAMALGLSDHVWTYRDYIWLPVHPDQLLRRQMNEHIQHLLTPALEDTPCTYTCRKPPSSETKQEHPIPLRKAP